MSILRCCRYFLPRRRETILRNFVFLFALFVCFAVISSRLDIARFAQLEADEQKQPNKEKPQHEVDGSVNDENRKKRSHEKTRQIYEGDSKIQRTGPGEKGGGVSLTEAEKKEADELMKKWFFNIIASDKISLDRTVPDTRHEE